MEISGVLELKNDPQEAQEAQEAAPSACQHERTVVALEHRIKHYYLKDGGWDTAAQYDLEPAGTAPVVQRILYAACSECDYQFPELDVDALFKLPQERRAWFQELLQRLALTDETEAEREADMQDASHSLLVATSSDQLQQYARQLEGAKIRKAGFIMLPERNTEDKQETRIGVDLELSHGRAFRMSALTNTESSLHISMVTLHGLEGEGKTQDGSTPTEVVKTSKHAGARKKKKEKKRG